MPCCQEYDGSSDETSSEEEDEDEEEAGLFSSIGGHPKP